MSRPQAHLLRDDRGQTAVEFALLLPILTVLLLGVIQLGTVFNNYETITDAARAGSRQAILLRLSGGSPDVAADAARRAAGALDPEQLGVSVTASPDWSTSGNDVSVTVTYPYSIDLLGWVVQSGQLSSTMTERLE
jgi:Flp pilus assembly protein TadG